MWIIFFSDECFLRIKNYEFIGNSENSIIRSHKSLSYWEMTRPVIYCQSTLPYKQNGLYILKTPMLPELV